MNWEQFLTENSVEYVTSGPNTKRGEVSVQCPFCGSDDPSQHMGINLEREAWGCHRNAEHRGKAPYRLVQGLLGCTMAQARLAVAQYTVSDPDSMEGAIAMLNATTEAPKAEAPKALKFPEEFKRADWWSERFCKYLAKRGFGNPVGTARDYGLMCADTGRFKDRIIFPIHLNGLIGWTGRAIIDPKKAPRYLASGPEAKASVYGYEFAKNGGEILYVVEGPFDALKLNCTAKLQKRKIFSVATMGTSVTVGQLGLLRGLRKKYKEMHIWFDDDAWDQSARLADLVMRTHHHSLIEKPAPCWKDPASTPTHVILDMFAKA